MAEQFGTCTCCGRSDVPICPKCGKHVPHGNVSGTWLPCWCDGYPCHRCEAMPIDFDLSFYQGAWRIDDSPGYLGSAIKFCPYCAVKLTRPEDDKKAQSACVQSR